MKFLKKHKLAVIAVAIVAALVVSCMDILDIILPENAQTNSEVEITVTIQLTPESDDNSNLAFAVLAPKSWDLASNAKLSLTTSNYTTQGYDDVTDEALELIPDTQIEPYTGLSYPLAYQSKIGLMGNTGPVEWTVFQSSTEFHINDNVSTEPIIGTVTIKLTTGPTPIKFFMGFGFCGTHRGLDDGDDARYDENEQSRVFTVYGEGDMEDYTVTQTVSTVPSTFRYGDIFSVIYDAEDTELEGASAVYLCGKAVLLDGTEVEVSTPSNKNLMEATSETTYMKYIYPIDFFNLDIGTAIDKIYVWFSNADGSIVTEADEDGHLVKQADQ